jgi:hypothetical protein
VDLLDWLRFCPGGEHGDYLFTRYNPSPKPGSPIDKWLLQRADVAEAVKASATALDLDPAKFSTSSARKCFTTHTTANGLGEDKRNRRAGWVKGSKTVDDHYNKLLKSRGVFALGGDAFTIHDVARLTQRTITDKDPGSLLPGLGLTALRPRRLTAGKRGDSYKAQDWDFCEDEDSDDLQCMLSYLSDTAFGYETEDGSYISKDLGDLELLGDDFDDLELDQQLWSSDYEGSPGCAIGGVTPL